MKLTTAHKLYKPLLAVSLLTGLAVPILGHTPLATGLLLLCVVAFIAAFLLLTRFHRCPHCGEVVNPRGKLPKTCPECGKPLGEAKR